jgi:hypothetical protein
MMDGYTNDVVFFGVRLDAADEILDVAGHKVRSEFYSENMLPRWGASEMYREFIVELKATNILKHFGTVAPARAVSMFHYGGGEDSRAPDIEP